MPRSSRFSENWPKVKEQLSELAREALILAKRGEEQLEKAASRGKLQLEQASLAFKRDQFLYLIGREYVKAKFPARPTPALKRLLSRLQELDIEKKAIRKRLKRFSK